MNPNIGYYIQTINEIVKTTENIGGEMNHYYEEVRQAIDKGTTDQLTSDKLKEIRTVFGQGTQQYEGLLQKIEALRPPARVMGIHKKLERAYVNYIAGCKEMIASLNEENGVDTALFNASEVKQDEATDVITFSITRMSNLLLKK